MEITEIVVPEFLTYEQARQYCGLSRQSIWRLVRDGEVEAYKVNSRSVRIVRRSLDGYLTRQPIAG